jgi:hypothetical protein
VEKTVIACRADLTEPTEAADQQSVQRPTPVADTTPAPNRLAVRTQERYKTIQALREQGRSISAISRELDLDRKTVRWFAEATDVAPLLVKARHRDSLLDAFKPHLHKRFNAGHTDAAALTNEIQALGYRGSDKTVRRYLHPFRTTLVAPPPTPIPPSARQATGWLTRRPTDLDKDDRTELRRILDRSEVLTTTHQQVRDFAEILTTRRGDRLTDWIADVDTNGAPALRSFVAGLRTDLDAVTNGLTLHYSSGPVEGTVNRIKMIKRQMFGRAKFDLLRKRILNPA